MPVPEPASYDGNPLKYSAWRISFRALVENRSVSQTDNIYYLKRYLSGKAHSLVGSLFLIDHENAYDEAWAL